MVETGNLNHTKIQSILDFQEVKITALNRGFIMLLNVLKHRSLLNDNDVSWIDRVKRDSKLAKLIDTEDLMDKVLEVCSKISCPDKGEDAANLAKSYKPTIKLPKL